MTWQGKRRAQLPRNWAALRNARLEVDGHRCTALIVGEGDPPSKIPGLVAVPVERCTARATDVHHALDPDDHRIGALASLCDWHHKQETQREAAAARAAKPKRSRPRDAHPGLR